jgi:molybdenum cofactor cytidylyltransferase
MPDDFFCCGILLAAGQGKRFDPSGRQHKLLQVLPSGQNVVSASARNLQQVFPRSWGVLADQSLAIQASLQACNFPTYFCPDAALGMAHSLRTGIEQLPVNADAFVIALADMPFVSVQSLMAIRDGLAKGADIVVPVYRGQRGNPVGFSRRYLPQLFNLSGDRGARQLLQTQLVTEIDVDDPGILQDIDRPEDLFDDIEC